MNTMNNSETLSPDAPRSFDPAPPPASAPPSPADSDPAVEIISDETAKLREERDEFHQLLLRTKAEFENYQKRAARETEQERKFAQRPLANEILPAIDNLDRFLASVREETPLSKIVASVQAQLVVALRKHGVHRIEAKGQPFDPNRHEAILQQPAAEVPANTVLQELEAGYVYHERVLRPAKVMVSTRAESS